MIKIALTGSIGMGKSTVLNMFAGLGASVWSADEAVHRMYEKDGAATKPLAEIFPDAIINGAVDRARLAGLVLGAPENLRRLEELVHPLVAADREAFMTAAAHAGAKAAVLDIPLLFENNAADFFDAVIVVSAPSDVQRARVLARPGMSKEKLAAILAQQMPDHEKREKADYVINTSQALEKTTSDVARLYDEIIQRAARD